MEKVIYTKYSNDRDEQFNIVTRMIKDENALFVRKEAVSELSIPHINGICNNQKALEKQFENSRLAVNKCVKESETGIRFDYEEGVLLHKQIRLLEKKKKTDEIKKLTDDFEELINFAANEAFAVTEEFREFFGDEAADRIENDKERFGSLKSMKYSNLDMLLSNIIITDNGWVNIDYEWVVDFGVPADFIIYRAYKYSESSICRAVLKERFGESQTAVYELMDEAFQAVVRGEHKSLSQMWEMIRGRIYSSVDISRGLELLDDKSKDNEINNLRNIISNIENSRSYKMTKPIRSLKKNCPRAGLSE